MPESAEFTDLGAEEARLEREAPGYLTRVRHATARLGQRAAGPTDTQAALVAVEELAQIDVDVPTGSRYTGARRLKTAVKQLVGWYLRYVGDQISSFGQAVAHLGELLVQRTEQIEIRTTRLEDRSTRLETGLADLADRLQALEQHRADRSSPPRR
ncbi:MAG: hypothetical protein JO337_04540 [Acidimicrobiales bacterium]|nr:hypothetical protein [Acidimicrobiales bacterium]